MMVLSALRPDASLAEFLAHRASSASLGLLGAAAVMYGVWAIALGTWIS